MNLHGDIMMAVVCAAAAVPAVNSLLVYGMLHRLTARLGRMTSGLTEQEEIEELYGRMMTAALAGAIIRARRRFALAASWTLLIPIGWYLFAPLPQLNSCETALAALLCVNAAMLAVNTLIRIRMGVSAQRGLACVMEARTALKKYSFRQFVTLCMTIVLGGLMFG